MPFLKLKKCIFYDFLFFLLLPAVAKADSCFDWYKAVEAGLKTGEDVYSDSYMVLYDKCQQYKMACMQRHHDGPNYGLVYVVPGHGCVVDFYGDGRKECVSDVEHWGYTSCDASGALNSSTPVSEQKIPEQSSSWFSNLISALFSWNSTSWNEIKQQAVDYWQTQAQAAEKEGSPLQYFYELMAGLAGFGSKTNLALLALSVIPLASLTKLFTLGSLGPKLTLSAVESGLPNIPVIFKNIPYSGVAGIGNGVNYTQAGTIAIKQALAGNPISNVIIKHEAAHLLGASEVGAWKITSQAFSSLSLGEKLRSLGTLAGANTALAWTLEKTLPTLNRTLMQIGYLPNLITQKLTWNIWKGY